MYLNFMTITISTSLEEIVFEDGKALKKSDNSKVKSLSPIGAPVMIGELGVDVHDLNDSQLIYIDQAAPEEANAYCLGDSGLVAGELIAGEDGEWYGNPVQYYRIN